MGGLLEWLGFGSAIQEGANVFTDTSGKITSIIKDSIAGTVTVIQQGEILWHGLQENFFATVQDMSKDILSTGVDIERNIAFSYIDTEEHVAAILSSTQKNFFKQIDAMRNDFFSTLQFGILSISSGFIIVALMFGDVIVNNVMISVLRITEKVIDKVHIG